MLSINKIKVIFCDYKIMTQLLNNYKKDLQSTFF